MLRRFTLVHLLLGVILINVVLVTLYILAQSGSDAGIVRFFGALLRNGESANSAYLFLSVLVFTNAALILLLSYVILIPVLSEGAIYDHRQLASTLGRSAQVGDEAKMEVLKSLFQEREALHRNRRSAGLIFGIGAVLFVLLFPALCYNIALTYADATPMFAKHGKLLPNGEVDFIEVVMFGGDQILKVILFDTLEVFGLQFGPLAHNVANQPFAMFVLVFRFAVFAAVVTVLLIVLKRVSQGLFWRGYATAMVETEQTDAALAAARDREAAPAEAHS